MYILNLRVSVAVVCCLHVHFKRKCWNSVRLIVLSLHLSMYIFYTQVHLRRMPEMEVEEEEEEQEEEEEEKREDEREKGGKEGSEKNWVEEEGKER